MRDTIAAILRKIAHFIPTSKKIVKPLRSSVKPLRTFFYLSLKIANFAKNIVTYVAMYIATKIAKT